MNPHRRTHRTIRSQHRCAGILVAAGLVALTACGDDASGAGNDAPADPPAAEPAAEPAPEPEAVEHVLDVVMADFHYGDLPSEVSAGTQIQVSNDSENELHEFVAFRLDDADTRPIEEIVAGDLGALLGSGEPATVLLAAPGGEQIPAVGDGSLSEPGRYVIVCVVPTGAEPVEHLEAAATSDGPPRVDGGPPHVVNGMHAERPAAEPLRRMWHTPTHRQEWGLETARSPSAGSRH